MEIDEITGEVLERWREFVKKLFEYVNCIDKERK